VVLVGFGGRGADVAGAARALRAPVITTYKAKGAIPEGRGWSAGAASLSPVVDAIHQRLLAQADGVVLIGWDPVELRDHWMPGWPEGTPVFVVDDHQPTDLPTRIDASWVGPIRDSVAQLVDVTSASEWTLDDVARHRDAVEAVFEERTFGPATVIRAVQAATPDDVVVTLDVGAHRITASNVWRCARPDALLQSNGLASMGYGLPAAIAAAAHGRRALCVTGDAGLQLVAGELGTAVEVGGALVVVVLVDGSLSLIGLKQQRAGRQARGVSFRNPDWAALARSFGARGVMTSSSDEVRAAVAQAFIDGGVTVIAAHFDATPYVRQM
jgi:acetolactate synthase-1/2/3 large subunit